MNLMKTPDGTQFLRTKGEGSLQVMGFAFARFASFGGTDFRVTVTRLSVRGRRAAWTKLGVAERSWLGVRDGIRPWLIQAA